MFLPVINSDVGTTAHERILTVVRELTVVSKKKRDNNKLFIVTERFDSINSALIIINAACWEAIGLSVCQTVQYH